MKSYFPRQHNGPSFKTQLSYGENTTSAFIVIPMSLICDKPFGMHRGSIAEFCLFQTLLFFCRTAMQLQCTRKICKKLSSLLGTCPHALFFFFSRHYFKVTLSASTDLNVYKWAYWPWRPQFHRWPFCLEPLNRDVVFLDAWAASGLATNSIFHASFSVKNH